MRGSRKRRKSKSSIRSLTLKISTLAVLPVAAFALSGCSFLFVDGPPSDYSDMNYVQCTESETAPVLDAIWAGLNAAGTVAIIADPDAYEDDWGTSSGAGIAVGAGWTALSTTAAFVGFNKVSDCREAKREIADRQAESESSQQGGEEPNLYEERLYDMMQQLE